jgi:hypothetical protein
MSHPKTTAQSFMAVFSAMAPNIEMPETFNKWATYKNSGDYKALGSAIYASFFSPFETLIEFGVQALTTAAISTFFSLATIILAAAALYFLAQAIQTLFFTQNENKGSQALNHFKFSVILAASAYIVSIASAVVMPILLTSLALRSAVTLYENRSSVAGFFKSTPNPLDDFAHDLTDADLTDDTPVAASL